LGKGTAAGTTDTVREKLREQLQFDKYLSKRSADITYTFRQHLRTIGGAIEELPQHITTWHSSLISNSHEY